MAGTCPVASRRTASRTAAAAPCGGVTIRRGITYLGWLSGDKVSSRASAYNADSLAGTPQPRPVTAVGLRLDLDGVAAPAGEVGSVQGVGCRCGQLVQTPVPGWCRHPRSGPVHRGEAGQQDEDRRRGCWCEGQRDPRDDRGRQCSGCPSCPSWTMGQREGGLAGQTKGTPGADRDRGYWLVLVSRADGPTFMRGAALGGARQHLGVQRVEKLL